MIDHSNDSAALPRILLTISSATATGITLNNPFLVQCIVTAISTLMIIFNHSQASPMVNASAIRTYRNILVFYNVCVLVHDIVLYVSFLVG